MSAHSLALLSIALACLVGAGHVTAYYDERTAPQLLVAEPTDEQIRDRIIEQSIARYPGACPCPYHADHAGGQCGGRSAWSQARGAAPVCFRTDVSEEMIRAWRARTSG